MNSDKSNQDIGEDMFNKLANMAKLSFSEQERANIKKSIPQILSAFEEMSAVNTDNVEPLIANVLSTQQLRDDVVKDKSNLSKIAEFSPHFNEEGYFIVPIIVD